MALLERGKQSNWKLNIVESENVDEFPMQFAMQDLASARPQAAKALLELLTSKTDFVIQFVNMFLASCDNLLSKQNTSRRDQIVDANVIWNLFGK